MAGRAKAEGFTAGLTGGVARGGMLGGIVVLLALSGWGIYRNGGGAVPAPGAPQDTASADASDAVVPAPARLPEPAAASTAPPATKADTAAAADLPRIATWLVTPDGMATIAGHARPGDMVVVLHNGTPVGEARVNGQGEFALVTILPADDEASLMTLVATGEDGIERAAAASVAIGPILGRATPPAASAPDTTAPAQASTGGAAPEPLPTPAPTAAAPVPVLAMGPEGATLLQDSTPARDQPALRVETIAYTDSGAVQLGGAGARGAAIRIYLDNAAVSELTVPESGKWLTTLDDIAPGLYTMRVDQLDGSGKVVARSESPFRRETLATLAEASAIASAASAAPAAVAPPEPATATLTEGVSAAAPAAAPVATSGAPPLPSADPAPVLPVASSPPVSAAPTLATGESPAAPDAVAAEGGPVAPLTITVQPGFSLWSIAQGELGSGIRYVQVFEANRDRIRDPDLIYPGQVLTVPRGN